MRAALEVRRGLVEVDEEVERVERLQQRTRREPVAGRYGARTVVSEAARDAILARADLAGAGARSIETSLSQTVLPDLSARFLAGMAEGRPFAEVRIDVGPQGEVVSRLVETA